MRCDVPVRRISRPSTMIASGASAPRAPVTRISKCTVSPSAASELFKTAVTLGESACANCAPAITPRTANNLRQCMRISISYQLSTINLSGPLTSPYRHGALLCVHQVEPAPPRLSWIPEAPRPGVRSSGPPSRVRLRQPARAYRAAFVICRRRLPSLRRGSAILRLGVRLVRVKAVGLVASRPLEREKGSRQDVAVFFAARSLPATGCSFPVGLSGSQTCPVTPDPAIAAGHGLSAVAAGPGLAVVAVAAAAAAVVVDSAAAAFSCEQAQRVVEALGH